MSSQSHAAGRSAPVAALLRSTVDAGATAPISPFVLLLRGVITFLPMWVFARIVIAWIYRDHLPSGSALEIFWIGLRVDLITLGWAIALPVIALPIAATATGARLWAYGSRLWFVIALVGCLVLEIASPAFLHEYQVRPNRLFLDYLDRPREVLPMLWGGFRTSFLIGIGALTLGAAVAWRWFALPSRIRPLGWSLVWIWPLLIVVCTLMIRSSLQHRPANPSLFARWDDTVLNQMALNGVYTLGYAAYSTRHEADVGKIYGELDEQLLQQLVKADPRFSGSPDSHPTTRALVPVMQRERPLNLIVVVEESLGAGFSGRLGGEGLTPKLDRWADKGWWFTQLFATGTRSARGLEAIAAGFPPSPAQSVLKRPRSQKGFATLASVLREKGYRNEFVYGGESHFDNMAGFFLGNGFHRVYDQNDYKNPTFRGSWGVSDDDLFALAHERAMALSAEGRSFFSLVFTSSNHTPFEHPKDRIPASEEPNTVRSAVRYADEALGTFLDKASAAPYFPNTLLLVVADHDVRVYGDDIVPLERFRVPGLLLGADVKPKVISSIASQIDLAPTLLSYMGVQAVAPFPGRDLQRSLPEFGVTDGPAPRALIQFNDTFARYEEGLLSVLTPGGQVRRFSVAGPARELTPSSPPSEVERQRLLADVHLPAWLYENDAYGAP